jgi:5'-nucleotidase
MGAPAVIAQHSLTVLAIREAEGPLTPGEALRELLHDATEFMLGWDCITPLKAQLGKPFRDLEARLQSAIDTRYQLPEWTREAYAIHKQADRLAAASEAFHVVGWSRADMRKTLRIAEVPLRYDPLSPCGFAPWEPWPPRVAQRLFAGLWCKCWRSAQESAREPDADHAPSTAFQISGAVLFLTRSLPSLN